MKNLKIKSGKFQPDLILFVGMECQKPQGDPSVIRVKEYDEPINIC